MKRIFRHLIRVIKQDEMRILPGNLAFFLVLSVVPIITLLGFIASMFSISLDSLTSFMNDTFPKEVSNLLLPFISGRGINGNIVLFMIIGFFAASNGPHSIIIASDTLFGIKPDNSIARRVKSIFLTILLVNLFLFILVILAFGNMILSEMLKLDLLSHLNNNIYDLFVLFKWPVAFILIYITIKIIYTVAPGKKIKSRHMTLGALFTTIGWIIVTAFYSLYIQLFANYDALYGGLSSIIVLMIWVYILSYIFVVGIAINTNVYRIMENNSKNN